MKRLLRGVIQVGETISAEHLAHNYHGLAAGLAAGLSWELPEDPAIWKLIHEHTEAHGEAPSITLLEERVGHNVELRERLKDIVHAQVWVRTNYRALVKELTERSHKVRVAASIKEAKDILDKRGIDAALAFMGKASTELAAKTEKKRRIAVMSTADLLVPVGPVPWLCEGLRIAPGGVTMFAGYGFSGKTMVAQHLALCVASRRPVMGVFPVATAGRVVHLDYEQGSRLTRDRYQRLMAGMGITGADLGDRLVVAPLPNLYLDVDEDALDVLEELVGDAALLVVDSFKAATPSTKENDASARIPLDLLARLTERTGVVPLVIDHARKQAQGAETAETGKYAIRGNGAKYDALTTAFVFLGEKGKPTVISHEKCRHRGGDMLPDFGVRVVDIEVGGNPHGGLRLEYLDHLAVQDLGAEAQTERADALGKRIRGYLSAQPDQTFRGSRTALAAAIGGKKDAALTEFRAMLARGEIAEAGSATAKIIRLTDAPPTKHTNGVSSIGVDDLMDDLIRQV